uniref:Putative secreted protein n=1 Tax=Ixodes ricinus TaxID=34613 RepID=A0A6B0V3U6_IXORI
METPVRRQGTLRPSRPRVGHLLVLRSLLTLLVPSGVGRAAHPLQRPTLSRRRFCPFRMFSRRQFSSPLVSFLRTLTLKNGTRHLRRCSATNGISVINGTSEISEICVICGNNVTSTTSGIVNSGTVNSEIVNSGTVNSETVNSGTVNSGTVNSEIVNSEIVNSEIVNSEIVNSGIVNSEIVNSEIVNSVTCCVTSQSLKRKGRTGTVAPVRSNGGSGRWFSRRNTRIPGGAAAAKA